MTWVWNVLGAALVLGTLRDVFHTLWHPGTLGTVSGLVFRGVWRLGHRLPFTELAGPVATVLVIWIWTTAVVLGWALVYLPHMPEQFVVSSSGRPPHSPDAVSALYLSLVTVGTLGFGDVVPVHPALQLTVPLQALLGFMMFTAAISWILQVYPALTRRRALAERLSVMAATDTVQLVETGAPEVLAQLFGSLVEAVSVVAVDLNQFGESYYFRESSPERALAANLGYALDLAAAGKRHGCADVRHLAGMLEVALERTADALTSYVGRAGTVTAVLDAYARDHHHRPVATGR